MSTRRIRALHRRLRKHQGPFTPKRRRPILDELVMTVLSQATSDTNSERAFKSLKARFSGWQQVLEVPTVDVADAIRAGGIADVKAARIQVILREVEEREGKLDLRRLAHRPDEEVVDYLCSLPGVGPKTAACVLLFAMNRPAFPVDTHVHRIAARLRLVPTKASAEAAHRLLEPTIVPELRYELHMQLIEHGRTICKPRMPLCSACPIFDLCPSGPQLLAAGAAR